MYMNYVYLHDNLYLKKVFPTLHAIMSKIFFFAIFLIRIWGKCTLFL